MVDGNDDEVGLGRLLGGNGPQLRDAELVKEPHLLDDLALLPKLPAKTAAHIVITM